MKRTYAVAFVMIFCINCAKANSGERISDVGIVLDISGDWTLQGPQDAPAVKLHKGYALPAGGTVSSGPTPGRIVVHIYNKTQPDSYSSSASSPSTFILPVASDRFPGFSERFWKVFQRLFGRNPEDYVVTISQISIDTIFVSSWDPPSRFNDPALIESEPAYLYTVKPIQQNLLGVSLFTSAPQAAVFHVTSGSYFWNADGVFHTGDSYHVSTTASKNLSEYIAVSYLSLKRDLRETVLEFNDGWVDIRPLVGNEPLGANAIVFRRIDHNDQPTGRRNPDILFTWPTDLPDSSKRQSTDERYEVMLLPGLYRASYFSLNLNQPEGDDAWVLVEQTKLYEKSRRFFDESSRLIEGWPKDLDPHLQRTFLRVCLQYLLEPSGN